MNLLGLNEAFQPGHGWAAASHTKMSRIYAGALRLLYYSTMENMTALYSVQHYTAGTVVRDKEP